MKILRLRLENFQGIRSFEMSPQGASCSVYGDNGTGKSTIYNAFTWLMYGKASTGEKNYSPKTAGSHNLHHLVELDAELDDGSLLSLSKDYHEVYKTVRGSANEVFAGHTTDYAVDGVPVNETQFKKTLAGIYQNEDLTKILTMFDYFLDVMPVKERRKVLLDVCGDVDFDTVVASDPELSELPGLLVKPGNTSSKYTVEEYQAVAAKEKSLIDKELKDIPHRIDEAEKAKPDTGGMDEETAKKKIEKLKEMREDLTGKLAAGESAAEAEVRKRIAEEESHLAQAKAAHDRGEAEKNKGVFERIGQVRYLVSAAENEMIRMNLEQKEHREEAARLAKMRERLLEEWKEEDARQWKGDTVCPTCGRPLPAEQVGKAIEAFNVAKSKRLEEINRRGMETCSSAKIKAEQDAEEAIGQKIADKCAERDALRKELLGAEAAALETVSFTSTDEYKEINGKLEELKRSLEDMKETARAADSELRGACASVDAQIYEVQQAMSALRFVKQQDVRIAELEAREKELAGKYEHVQHGISLCELYTRKQASLLDEKINSRFETLRFRLFIEQQNGGIADDCEAMVPCDGRLVPFKSANNAARINAGLEVIDTLAGHYGVFLPVFVDNAESVTKLRHTDTQVIRLVVSEQDKDLRFEAG